METIHTTLHLQGIPKFATKTEDRKGVPIQVQLHIRRHTLTFKFIR